MKMAYAAAFLYCLTSCREPENTPMHISGRIIDSATSTAISGFMFELGYPSKGRSGVMGNIDFGAHKSLRSDAHGNFQVDFQLSPGSTYTLSTFQRDTFFKGTQNGSLGDLLVSP